MEQVSYNLLDELVYHELLDQSDTIKQLIQKGQTKWKRFDRVSQIFFFSLYKHLLLVKEPVRHHTIYMQLHEFLISNELTELRHKTSDNPVASFLVLKELLEAFLQMELFSNQLPTRQRPKKAEPIKRYKPTVKKQVPKVFSHEQTTEPQGYVPLYISQAVEATRKTEWVLRQFSIDPDSIRMEAIDEVFAILKRIQEPELKQWFKRLVESKRLFDQGKFFHSSNRETMECFIRSGEIDYLCENEYLSLGMDEETIEMDFLYRMMNEQLMSYSWISQRRKRPGRIIICYDGSSSMTGAKNLEARLIILLIIELARHERVPVELIQFASTGVPLIRHQIKTRQTDIRVINDLLNLFMSGGTNYNQPLSMLLDLINEDKRDSNVVFITDGQAEVSPALIERYRQSQEHTKISLTLIFIDEYEISRDHPLKKISDHEIFVNYKKIGRDRQIIEQLIEYLD